MLLSAHKSARAQRFTPWVAGALVAVLALPAAAQLVYNTNTHHGNVAGTCSGGSGGAACSGGVYSDCDLFNTKFPNNQNADPQLNASIANPAAPRWNPAASSPALAANGAAITDAPALDAWFHEVCYQGAIDAVASDNDDWTTGWTWYGQGGDTPEACNDTDPVVMVTADIGASTTWYADTTYVLVGQISVNPPATLTIEAGSLILGQTVGSFLVIERGADIQANGTRTQPIVFTSAAPCGQQLPGDWGGVVIHGLAQANCADVPPAQGGTGCRTTDGINSCVSEGGAGSFGGTDDDDNSGSMRYCRIEYSGQEIAPNNELNCLTMNAVGRNTTFEYLQVHRGTDDGFEWFGGTARCRWLVSTSQSDDNLDWQMGYRGRVQFAVVRQVSGDGADKGIEADNNEFNNDCPLESNPIMSNLTLVGVLDVSGVGTAGVNPRRGTNGSVVNSIVTGFTGFGLDIDNPATFANCAGPVPALQVCTTDVGPHGRAALVVTAGPNPAFGSSTLLFELATESQVDVRIYDASGRLVDTVLSERMSAGAHRLPWQPQNGASGAYFYQVVANGQKASGRVLFLN